MVRTRPIQKFAAAVGQCSVEVGFPFNGLGHSSEAEH
ncbi:hypothetical protein CH063_14733 [Colletotrichum higginsianum]|uniref:Uncharacterized protein n=1 Tax=Colletotrichum higginsianum (strain IMI 349063) TaxID=759273 RepID=H1VZV4_COLHI|nr:hypothetical protein CH063_14733 [Colletotrichum higginsianum]